MEREGVTGVARLNGRHQQPWSWLGLGFRQLWRQLGKIRTRRTHGKIHRNNREEDQFLVIFQDDSSSQTSMRDLKEEALHFQVAYELNDEKNETIRFDCDKYVF